MNKRWFTLVIVLVAIFGFSYNYFNNKNEIEERDTVCISLIPGVNENLLSEVVTFFEAKGIKVYPEYGYGMFAIYVDANKKDVALNYIIEDSNYYLMIQKMGENN